MTNKMTPQEKFNLGAKYKKAGILVAIIGSIIVGAGGALWGYGQHLQLQAQAEAKAQGIGTLTITPAPQQQTPLGGSSAGEGKVR